MLITVNILKDVQIVLTVSIGHVGGLDERFGAWLGLWATRIVDVLSEGREDVLTCANLPSLVNIVHHHVVGRVGILWIISVHMV